jgi:hypothetical protein
MNPEKDLKVWNMTIKGQIQSLEDSVDKCDVIIKRLSTLQKNVAKAQDDLEKEIDNIKNAL